MSSSDIKFIDLKSLILSQNEPIIINNVLKWPMLNWTLKDWESILDKEKLQFRFGLNEPTQEPQWERKTKVFEGDFNYFLKEIESNWKEWLYFDYKQLNNCFKNNARLRNEIDWSPLGFPDIKADDCTIWIGSKGAHTPCHMDCYGFNLVYQIYGSKTWILFPPEENLKPTRVPYEESSIYSKLNFFSPNMNDFKNLDPKCRKIELHPGDVLIVPHKWWHYVENLETSISINVWLPREEDDEERLQESIVQLFVKQMTRLLNNDANKIVLNPNMDELILENSSSSFLDTIIRCKRICSENHKKNKQINTKLERNVNPTEKYNFIQTIPILCRDDFINFLENQNNRFSSFKTSSEVPQPSSECVELVESFTHPLVIEMMKNLILNNTLN